MTGMATARYYPGTFTESKPLDARSIAYLAVGVGALSAFMMFFWLCQRDHSYLLQVDQAETPFVISQAAPPAAPAASTIVPVSIPAPAPAPLHVRHQSSAAVPESIPFRVTRSKHFERVGPISLGLWKTDVKHATYDVSLLIDGHRFDKKHVRTDEALAISIGGAQPMELIVNRVGRNEISGYLKNPEPAASN